MNRLIVTKRKNKILTCSYEENHLTMLRCEEETESMVGNIYIGRIQNIVKNINAAFVEIQNGVIGYLPLLDATAPFLCNRVYDGRLKEGDEILLQIVRDRVRTKDAVISTNLSFAGRYVVISTQNKKIGFSNKLSKRKKEFFKETLAPFFDQRFGYVIRTNAGDLKETEMQVLIDEMETLSKHCEEVFKKATSRTLFSCLYETPKEYLIQIRDTDLEHIKDITTDCEDIYQNTLDYMSQNKSLLPFVSKINFYQDESYSLHNLVRLEKQIEDALAKKVWLDCGGYLIIEPTEALIVIDVNSGKYDGKKEMEDTFLKINTEAAVTVIKQLKLRNLSGIIIIDFINMKKEENEKFLLEILRKECKKDSTTTNVIDITPLGLVEVTRKRVYPSLKEQLGE